MAWEENAATKVADLRMTWVPRKWARFFPEPKSLSAKQSKHQVHPGQTTGTGRPLRRGLKRFRVFKQISTLTCFSFVRREQEAEEILWGWGSRSTLSSTLTPTQGEREGGQIMWPSACDLLSLWGLCKRDGQRQLEGLHRSHTTHLKGNPVSLKNLQPECILDP